MIWSGETRRRGLICLAGFAMLLIGRSSYGDTANIGAVKDNTLIEDPGGTFSNGAGPGFFSGRIGSPTNSIRRGLIAFDIAGNVPPGSTINSVTLTLNMSMTNAGPETINLHRVLADWGEGTSSSPGGSGAPSTTGDATWIHTFYPGSFWTSSGGDFAPTSSGSQVVDQIGTYTFGPIAAMTADVQSWLDTPAGNFGWELVGNEGAPSTVKRFDTRENSNPALRPMLTVDYTAPPPPIPTLSQWGTIVLALLLLCAGTIVIRGARRAQLRGDALS